MREDKKNTNTKYIITKIIAVIELFLIFTIFILFYLTRDIKTSRVVFIPKGNTNYTIKYLQKNNYDILNLDKPFIRLFGYLQAGWVDMKNTKMTKLDFFYRLTHNKAYLEKITIIPGESNYFIFNKIKKKLNIKYLNCNIDEGFIKPDTYFLPLGMSPNQVCKFLYKKSLKWHKFLSKKFLGVWDYKVYKRKLIIASIIQKETSNTKEMKLVSAVIYNRLKKHIKLQMDGSLNYGKYAHSKVTPQRIKKDFTHYNTYKFYGLPKKPICVVSEHAIVAAFFPAKVDYLYFVKCGKKHIFAKTYKQHIKNIKKCLK